MGASATQLSWLDTVQNAATTLRHESFILLQSFLNAAIVGLLLKLLIVTAVNFYRLPIIFFSTKSLTLRRPSILATVT